jgi:hypothetical protein
MGEHNGPGAMNRATISARADDACHQRGFGTMRPFGLSMPM